MALTYVLVRWFRLIPLYESEPRHCLWYLATKAYPAVFRVTIYTDSHTRTKDYTAAADDEMDGKQAKYVPQYLQG